MQARGSMGWLVVLVVALPGGLATVDLGDIDMEAIVERLISPVGMVNQFALQAETNAIGTAGWLGLGEGSHPTKNCCFLWYFSKMV